MNPPPPGNRRPVHRPPRNPPPGPRAGRSAAAVGITGPTAVTATGDPATSGCGGRLRSRTAPERSPAPSPAFPRPAFPRSRFRRPAGAPGRRGVPGVALPVALPAAPPWAPLAAGLLAAGLLAGCGGGAGGSTPAPPAPTTPAPAPPFVEASFGPESVEVFEGDTVEIPIRYESRNLAAPWRLRVSPSPGTAAAADFDLPDPVVEIPAGASASGEVPLALTGLFDADFEEGPETLTLQFVPDPAVDARLGGDLPVSIREGGALVSFGEEPAALTEGAAATLPIRYEVRNLPAPLSLTLSALPGTAGEEDFRLERQQVEIPAGKEVRGEVGLPVAAPRDALFAEADESFTLRFRPASPDGPPVRLGPDREVTLREGGAAPCPGLTISARPPMPSEEGDGRIGAGHLSTRVTVVREAAASGTQLILRSPYFWRDEFAESDYQPFAATRLARWRLEREGTTLRHSFDIEWPDADTLVEPDLEWGFLGGRCSGEPVAACSAAGCELTP